jgi:hypothetical protein
MKILNKNSIPYLSPSGISWRDSSAVVDAKLKDNDCYFLVEFFDKHSLSYLNELITENLKVDIQQKKIKLLLSNTHEAFNDYVFLLYKILVFNLKIPETQIVLLSEAADIDQEILIISKKLNKAPISVEWTRVFELSMQQSVKVLNISHQTLSFKKYNKKFLNFNRRWRIHRPTFVALLESHNILEQGYVSLAKSDDNNSWNNILGSIIEVSKDSEINKIILNNVNRIKEIKPLYLDILNLEENQVNLSTSSRNYYNDTYFSVVSETNFYKNFGSSPFLSEKTFKPIAEKHPFILLNRPGSLQKLKDIGYKTFSEVINEQYDTEEDDNKRLKMIVEEVVRLSNLSEKELNKFLHVCRKICNFNYRVLENKKTFSTKLI